MSSEAVGWVYRHSPFAGVDFAIHAAVADSANDQNDYRLWMSMETLARKARVSRASATRAVTKLVDAGYLERVDPPGEAARAGRTARYIFLFPDVDVVFETRRRGGSQRATPPAQAEPPGGSPRAAQVAHTEPQTQETTQQKPKRARSLPSDDFEPTDANRKLAAELELDLDAERAAWIDNAHAHGRTYADHGRAFSTWLRRAVEYGRARPRPATIEDLAEPRSGPTFVPDPEQSRSVERPEWRCAVGNPECIDGYVETGEGIGGRKATPCLCRARGAA